MSRPNEINWQLFPPTLAEARQLLLPGQPPEMDRLDVILSRRLGLILSDQRHLCVLLERLRSVRISVEDELIAGSNLPVSYSVAERELMKLHLRNVWAALTLKLAEYTGPEARVGGKTIWEVPLPEIYPEQFAWSRIRPTSEALVRYRAERVNLDLEDVAFTMRLQSGRPLYAFCRAASWLMMSERLRKLPELRGLSMRPWRFALLADHYTAAYYALLPAPYRLLAGSG